MTGWPGSDSANFMDDAHQEQIHADARITCPNCGGSGGIVHGGSGDGDYEDCVECCPSCGGFGFVYPEDLQKTINT